MIRWLFVAVLFLTACATLPPAGSATRLCSLDPETIRLRFVGWQPAYKITVIDGENRYTVAALLSQPPKRLVIFVAREGRDEILACRLLRPDGVLLEQLGPGLPPLSGITT